MVRVGEDALPDMVLEVDHTTDVRRWKLKVYQECGFPEIWVSVPWEGSLRSPGLTIHVRDGAGYRESLESRAFPGWKAKETHRALTEETISGAAWRALERVGRTMGAREGTRPEDDPLTRSLSAKARGGRTRTSGARGTPGAGYPPGCGLRGGPGVVRRARGADDRGARVYGRSGLPAVHRRGARMTPAWP